MSDHFKDDCPLCQRTLACKNGSYPFLIREFKNSYLTLGEHQFFSGYSVLVLKDHYREMTDIPEPTRTEVFQEMMAASQMIQDTFHPHKMNLCSLGNVVDHQHWHFFPRYLDDPGLKDPPWLRMNDFNSAQVSAELAQKIIKQFK